MKNKTAKLWTLMLAVLPVGAAVAQTAPATPVSSAPSSAVTPAPNPNDVLLAERLAGRAAASLLMPQLSTANYRQAAALLQAAARKAPTEPRYPRLRFEALLRAGEIEDAIEALVTYCRMEPTDLQAQANLIELYVQRMETADDKLRYLRDDLLKTSTIPSEVRSHASLLAARVYLERGDRAAAIASLNEAARLNPVNAEAQQLRFELVSSKGTASDRLNGLLMIVRAAPTRVGAVAAVAEELSRAGLGEDAALWYDSALGTFLRMGELPPHGFVIDYAARLLANGRTQDAGGIATRIIASDPSDPTAHLLRVATDRAIAGSTELPDSAVNHLKLARTALINQYMEVCLSAGIAGAATRPADTTEPFAYPDPVTVSRAIAGKKSPELVERFTAAAGDLALFELIFAKNPVPARPIYDALAAILPADALVLARIEGWISVVEGKGAEARARLTGVAERDPLAALGLVRLDIDSTDPALRQAAESRARLLRSSFSHGLGGAIVASELLPRRIPVVLPALAEQMKQQLAGFPSQILRFSDSPESFYVLRAEPLASVVDFGQPLMVRVTVINTSDLDLAMGEGSLRNDLMFDAVVRGLRPASFPSTATDRLGGPLVLRPRQAASRVIRLDEGALGTFLRNTPVASVPVFGSVMTNPVSAGRVMPGPGGLAVQFSRIVEQSPVPFMREEARMQLVRNLTAVDSPNRLSLIDAAVFYFTAFAAAGSDVPNRPSQEVLTGLRNAMESLLNSPDDDIRAYATYQAIRFSLEARRRDQAKAARSDPFWGTRLLSLAAMRDAYTQLPPDTDLTPIREQAAALVSDPDPTVAAYAQAVTLELEDIK